MTLDRIRGSITALITPFKSGQVDRDGYQDFVNWQVESGTHGVVPVGTTGESPTLSADEHIAVIKLCVEAVSGRIPVIAGTGSNNTVEAIHFIQEAERADADAALVVTPYYNKPNQEGLYQHFAAIENASDLPIFIYNIPGRSVIDMTVDTMARLYELPGIVGVKDATGDIARMSMQRHVLGPDFIQLSGEDATALAFNAHGGRGCISVSANVAPAECAAFQEATLAGDYKTALEIQDKLLPLHDAMFCEPSPGPAKYGVSLRKGLSVDVRLPLVPATNVACERVDAALAHAGIETG